MIVISTYNGQDYLPHLLKDIKEFNISNDKICIVDDKSTDMLFVKYLVDLKKDGYNILCNPVVSYELGALKYAHDNLKDDVWYSMQDSIRLKYNIFDEIRPKLTNKNMYTFLTFAPGIYDNMDDRTFLTLHYGTLHYSKGIFTNSIFALDEVIQRVKNDWYIPKNKIEAAGSERGISVVFERHGIEINSLGIYDPPKTSDPNGYPFFYKIYR